MLPTSLQLAMFDLAGTTVNDRIEGIPLMILGMMRAFAKQGIELTPEQIKPHRGKKKMEAVQTLLREYAPRLPQDADQIAATIYMNFIQELENSLPYVTEMEGATEIFQALKTRGVCVGVGSGFPTHIVEQLVSQLGWKEQGLIDYVGSAESVGAGRPDPKMIQDAMQKFGITDPRRVVKVGDTVVDIQEGKNAGVWTIAVLTGSHAEETLMAAEPDHILPSILELRWE